MKLEQRIAGKLPEIEIAGTMFYIDISMGELRSGFRLNSHILFRDLEEGADDTLRFAFNTETKQPVTIDPAIKEWPKDTVIIEIPCEMKLDPYGWARKHEFDAKQFAEVHWKDEALKGKIIPLEKTGYPDLIKKNNGLLQKTTLSRPGRKLK